MHYFVCIALPLAAIVLCLVVQMYIIIIIYTTGFILHTDGLKVIEK